MTTLTRKLRPFTLQRNHVLLLLVVLMLLLVVGPAAAQTATPVPPTAIPTNASIEIPTNVIFTETNTWIETFAPIAAIGIGITVALAVLGYLGKMIASAFKS